MKKWMLFIFATIVALVLQNAYAANSNWGPYKGDKNAGSPSSRAATANDPTEDTFGIEELQLDITSFTAGVSGDTLSLEMTFAGSISPPDRENPGANAIVGFIDIDTDQNPETGDISQVDIFSPYTSGLGVDYQVNLSDYDPGANAVWVGGNGGGGYAPITYGANSIRVSVPLSLLGGDDGVVNTATVIGTFLEPTDAAPNGSFLTSTQNAPGIPTINEWGACIFIILLTIMALSRLISTKNAT